MLGITPFGMFHTLIALIAVIAGFTALVRYREISLASLAGRIYVLLTIATCLTGFAIFRHGAFGKPHALGVLTLIVLALAVAAEKRSIFGRLAPYVATVGYTLTLFFHMIPGFTETATRVPAGRPLVASPEAPELLAAIGGVFVVFLIGMIAQVVRMRGRRAAGVAAAP